VISKRRKTKVVKVGNVKVGGSNPIVIQSMAKISTERTSDVSKQINLLHKAGSKIVRLAVKNVKQARALAKIKKQVKVALVADIHFDYRLALKAVETNIDKIRINPGNITDSGAIRELASCLKKAKIPLRLGFNSGSLPFAYTNKNLTKKMAEYCLKYIRRFEKEGFYDIIISLKTSDVLSTIGVNEIVAKKTDYPLHLGITATGPGISSVVKSSVGIGSLLKEGIGDTIRVSLTAPPVKEVEVAKMILQSLSLARYYPEVISCPTCGRCQVNLQKIAEEVNGSLIKMSGDNPKINKVTVAVMGCEVNGPGEARHADIGIACGKKYAALFKKGKIIKKIEVSKAKDELLKEIK
jgi:(E)-4-hydroxy-3-methylbut-2-enyl-diphosphate synthase